MNLPGLSTSFTLSLLIDRTVLGRESILLDIVFWGISILVFINSLIFICFLHFVDGVLLRIILIFLDLSVTVCLCLLSVKIETFVVTG
jgi:hypothetical protein